MNLIAENRVRKGLTQEEVAKATGIPLRTYVRIEGARSGYESVKAGNLQRIASFLGISVDDLLNPPQTSGERNISEPVGSATK